MVVFDDMSDAAATAKAETFRADTGVITGEAPEYNNGDCVWTYRRWQKVWFSATVIDTRECLTACACILSCEYKPKLHISET